MNYLLVIAVLFTVMLSTCKNASEPAQENTGAASVQDSAAISHEEHSDDDAVMVTLNMGQKWQANSETTQGIEKMKSAIEGVAGSVNPEDYHSLKVTLDSLFNSILQQCTMTGEAHNQLHNYLMPLKKHMEELDSDSIDECRETADKLKEYLGQYQNYFV